MPWLKLWTDILGCPKVWRVTEALRARYLLLLSVACTYDRDGKLPSAEDCAFYLRLDPEEMRSTLSALAEARLLDFRAKWYQIHDWAQWQSARSPAAEKQKRYRERRNALRNALPTGDVTRESRVGHSRARESQSQSQSQSKNLLPSPQPSPKSPRETSPPELHHPEAITDERRAMQAEINRKRRAARDAANGEL